MIRTVQDNRGIAKKAAASRAARPMMRKSFKESIRYPHRALCEDDEADDADEELGDEADVELANEAPKTIIIDGVEYDLVPHIEDKDADSEDVDDEDEPVNEDEEMTESYNRFAARHRSMRYRNLRG